MNEKRNTKKILLVDDQRGICEGLMRILQNFGYDVQILSDGKEFFSVFKRYKPDIILLDVFLSDIDGRDILRKLKSDRSTKDTPVVLMSAQLEHSQLAKETLADGFLSKPFDLLTLKDVLQNASVVMT